MDEHQDQAAGDESRPGRSAPWWRRADVAGLGRGQFLVTSRPRPQLLKVNGGQAVASGTRAPRKPVAADDPAKTPRAAHERGSRPRGCRVADLIALPDPVWPRRPQEGEPWVLGYPGGGKRSATDRAARRGAVVIDPQDPRWSTWSAGLRRLDSREPGSEAL
jgi:hypothetical protein